MKCNNCNTDEIKTNYHCEICFNKYNYCLECDRYINKKHMCHECIWIIYDRKKKNTY